MTRTIDALKWEALNWEALKWEALNWEALKWDTPELSSWKLSLKSKLLQFLIYEMCLIMRLLREMCIIMLCYSEKPRNEENPSNRDILLGATPRLTH